MKLSVSDRDRYWSKVEKSDGCWLWRGKIGENHTGGQFSYGGRKGTKLRASRVAYLLANGEFDESLFVLHTCDNPACVNPSHLFLGTHQDNMDDMVRKGRGRSGTEGKSKLSIGQHKRIAACEPVRRLADEFGVSKSLISYWRNKYTSGIAVIPVK